MKRNKAVEVIKEIFEVDSLGFLASFSDEQDEAIRAALFALENPEQMCCGCCETFADEDIDGDGWCYWRDKPAHCTDMACGAFDKRRSADET